MTAVTGKFIELDRSLDMARILYRHFMSSNPPSDGWVREFSTDIQFVRISRTQLSDDAGTWHRVSQLCVVGVLDAARAPRTGTANPAAAGRTA